jgi:ribosomal protein L11 methyltransferase
LGLCALLLGAGHADGLDIDPSAVRTSIENARLNGVGDRYHASVCDFCRDGSALGYDLVFSNIIADVILPLVPKIAGTGVLWLASGIIEHRLDDVLNAAEAEGLTIRAIRTEDGWCAVLFAS